MATIALIPYHWAADLNSSFALARKLIRRGHSVRFLCVPDVEDRIRSQGFEFSPFFEDVFPAGSIHEQNVGEAGGGGEGLEGFRVKLRAMCARLLDGEIERGTAGAQPNLFLVSSWMPWVAIAAQRMGVPRSEEHT